MSDEEKEVMIANYHASQAIVKGPQDDVAGLPQGNGVDDDGNEDPVVQPRPRQRSTMGDEYDEEKPPANVVDDDSLEYLIGDGEFLVGDVSFLDGVNWEVIFDKPIPDRDAIPDETKEKDATGSLSDSAGSKGAPEDQKVAHIAKEETSKHKDNKKDAASLEGATKEAQRQPQRHRSQLMKAPPLLCLPAVEEVLLVVVRRRHQTDFELSHW